MKRFSWLGCILATILHLCGTCLIYDADMRNARAMFIGQQPPHNLLLKVAAWVWLPLPLALKPLLDAAAIGFTTSGSAIENAPNYILYSVLIWSLIVGVAFGFLVARRRRARESSN